MERGGSAGARLWALADLRGRWRSLVLLGLLVGVTAGLSMAALAGARRTDTALQRLRVATNAPDAVVFPGQVGAYHPDWAPLRAQPEVRSVAVWDLLFGYLDGQSGALLFASHDGAFLGDVGRPVVRQGRMYDSDAPDEVVVDESLTKEFPVGSTFSFEAFELDQTDFGLAGEAPHGPQLTMKVVGSVRVVNEFLFTSEQIFVSPGFRARYADQVPLIENADVQLSNGSRDIAALQRDVNDLLAPGTPVLDLHAVSRRVDTTLAVERTALLLLGTVVALAGGLLVTQALIRSASLVGDDAVVLRAMGMTQRGLVSAAVQAHLVTSVTGIVAATVTAIVTSRFFPVGIGRRIDIDVGVHSDWTIIVPGLALTGAFVVLGVALVARRTARLATRTSALPPSALATAIRRRAPLVVGVGTAMAIDRGRGRTRVAVRPALVGAVVGVLGVVATLTINRGINDSLTHPARAGVTWDATAHVDLTEYQPNGLRSETIDNVLAAAPRGSSIAVIDRQVIDVGGVGIPAFALRQPQGDIPVTLSITKGRSPQTIGEAAIGPESARALHVHLGDTVTLAGDNEVLLVGIGLFPTDVHAEFDEGLWVTPEQLERANPSPVDGSAFQGDRYLALRFPADVDARTQISRMAQQLGPPVTDISAAEVPVELTNLRNVRTLPLVLAAFLALLAIAAVAHVLVTSSSRRRRDFAIMRALGLNRRAARLILTTQSTAIGLFGLLVGVPLGIVVGRSGWQWVATRVPLEDVPPFAAAAVILIVPATVAIVNALALWPGQRVARIRPAEALRAE